MSALLRNRFGRILFILVFAIATYALLDMTGFRAWYDASTIAKTIARVFGVLIFGVFGLFALFWPPRNDPAMRPLFYRLLGVAFLVVSAVQVTILSGDPLGIEGMAG